MSGSREGLKLQLRQQFEFGAVHDLQATLDTRFQFRGSWIEHGDSIAKWLGPDGEYAVCGDPKYSIVGTRLQDRELYVGASVRVLADANTCRKFNCIVI